MIAVFTIAIFGISLYDLSHKDAEDKDFFIIDKGTDWEQVMERPDQHKHNIKRIHEMGNRD